MEAAVRSHLGHTRSTMCLALPNKTLWNKTAFNVELCIVLIHYVRELGADRAELADEPQQRNACNVGCGLELREKRPLPTPSPRPPKECVRVGLGTMRHLSSELAKGKCKKTVHEPRA